MTDDKRKLLEGIAYFEKMQKVMPGDRTTLEFLSVAYEQIGDTEKLRLSLIQLAKTLLKEGDQEAAESIGERLDTYSEPDAKAMARQVRETYHAQELAADGGAGGTGVAANIDVSVAQAILEAVKAEASLIRLLANRNIVNPAEAEAVQKHLGGLPEATRPFLVSALSILYRESTSVGEKAAAFVADTSGMPPVSFSAFPPAPELMKLLPENIIRVRGVLPFAKLGDELMVAMLNPLDEQFRKALAAHVGGSCRFFTAHPAQAEEFLEGLFAQQDKEKDGGK